MEKLGEEKENYFSFSTVLNTNPLHVNYHGYMSKRKS